MRSLFFSENTSAIIKPQKRPIQSVENAVQSSSDGSPLMIRVDGSGKNIAERTEIKAVGGRKISAPVRMNDLPSLSSSRSSPREKNIPPTAVHIERKNSVSVAVSSGFSKRAIASRSIMDTVRRTKHPVKRNRNMLLYFTGLLSDIRLFPSGADDRQQQGGFQTADIGNAFPGNLESGAVINTGPDHRQAKS